MLKIALLSDGITPFVTGGMQRHSANLAKYFTLAGLKVTLVHCVSFGAKTPTDDEVNVSIFGAGNKIHLDRIITLHFPKPGKVPGHYIRNSYQYSKDIFMSLDWKQFDFVYAKGFCGWYYMEQKNEGVNLPPLGVKFHGYEMFQALPTLSQRIKAQLLKRATKWNNEHADYIFSYGGKITELILHNFKVPRHRVLEFTSGLDNEWVRTDKLNPSHGVTKFVFMGRAEVRKGIHELNKALKQLEIENKEQFEFHFIGPIEIEQRLEGKNFIYHGELKTKAKICEVLDSSDVLVCPSHSEGMPNVILEGMARGLAVLATNVGAVEIIVSTSNGRLINPLQVQEIFQELQSFVRMPKSELNQLRQESIEKINKFYLWDKVIQGKVNTITKIVQEL